MYNAKYTEFALAFAEIALDLVYNKVDGFWKISAYVPVSGLLTLILIVSKMFDYKIVNYYISFIEFKCPKVWFYWISTPTDKWSSPVYWIWFPSI